jgi:hypothetical protein
LNSETLQLIHQAYGNNAMGQAAVFKYWKHFRDGETNVKDEPCSSRGQNHLFHFPPEACNKRSATHFQEVGGVV